MYIYIYKSTRYWTITNLSLGDHISRFSKLPLAFAQTFLYFWNIMQLQHDLDSNNSDIEIN